MSTSSPVPESNLPVGTPLPTAAPPLGRKRSLLTRLMTGRRSDNEIVVFHHSTLFYWWPVWLLGFLFALVSYFDSRLAIVPDQTQAFESRLVEVDDRGTMEQRAVLILPKGTEHLRKLNAEGEEELFQPTIHVTHYRLLGTVFVFVLLLVTAITNVTIRGLWSFFVIFIILMLTVVLGVAGVWGHIFAGIGRLSIFINQGGYLAIAVALFVLWVVNFYAFDRQTYMIFTPGQVRVRLEIGGGETVYGTRGMVVQKQRADLFRHWILGFGSGDLIVRPAGQGLALEMPNVLNVDRVLRHIEDVIKREKIVAG